MCVLAVGCLLCEPLGLLRDSALLPCEPAGGLLRDSDLLPCAMVLPDASTGLLPDESVGLVPLESLESLGLVPDDPPDESDSPQPSTSAIFAIAVARLRL